MGCGNKTKSSWPLWQMWIVKRPTGGDGFWIMSSTDSENKQNVRLVAAIGLCTEDNDPLAKIIRGRPVEQYGGTKKSLSRVRDWVNRCNEHPKCNTGETLLPRRVLDVGDISSPYARLWETSGEEYGRYIAVSYCWGKVPQFTTTKANLEEHKRRITISELSKTHQDVIKLARELGVRYVWIDSICICQGDYDDWERESGKMLSIYANSYLTVAASKAKDNSEGLFSGTNRREYKTLEYASGELRGHAMAFNLPLDKESDPTSYITLPDEPLSERAWAFQERVLSRRTLLYTKQQMFFECSEGFRGEDGTVIDSRFESAHHMPNGRVEGKESENNGKEDDPKGRLYRSWYNLLWLYGPLKLTKASDKLPAISGLASIFAKLLKDRFVAGLWESRLIEELVWQGLRCRRVSEYRAPSWSWLSKDGIPCVGVEGAYEEVAKVLEVKVDLKGTNIYGEVTGGKLRIQAPMERLYLDVNNWDPMKPGFAYGNNPPIRTAHDKTHARFDFDYKADDAPQEAFKIVESLEGKEFFALILLRLKKVVDGESYHAILVRKIEGGEEYESLGFAFLDEKSLGRRLEREAQDALPVITLV